jgi:hypothetical protein
MGGINMRKILAITMAFMLAAIVLSPALGYTAQSVSKPAYSAQSGGLVKYSLISGASAHEMSQADEGTVREASVQTTRVPYSIKTGGLVPYSLETEEGQAGVKEVTEVVAQPPVEANETAGNVTPAEGNVTPVELKFALSGRVFNDLNSNGMLDETDIGLADWTVDLEKPSGEMIISAMTDFNGAYVFTNLSAGDYVVSVALPVGWDLVAPLDGKLPATITDADVSDLNFAVMMKVIAAPEVVPAPVVPELNVTPTLNNTPTLTTPIGTSP